MAGLNLHYRHSSMLSGANITSILIKPYAWFRR